MERAEFDRLLHRYGSLVEEMLALQLLHEPLAHLAGASGYLRAEVAYAVTHEGARHLDDVLSRRTRTAIETSDRGIEAADEVATLLAPLLGWSAATTNEEVARYRACVMAEQRAEQFANETAAVAALELDLDAS